MSIVKGPKMADFHNDLSWSRAQAALPLWEEVYRKAFPDFASMTHVPEDGWAQQGGVDRIVTTTSGKVWRIDEKCRRSYYEVAERFKHYFRPTAIVFPDILIEYIANSNKNTPGWAEKGLACDYINYNILPIRQCYLLPVAQLQQAWRLNKLKWIEEFGKRHAPNKGYWTTSCPVPVPVLMRAVCLAMWFMHEWNEEYEQYVERDKGSIVPTGRLPESMDLLFEL